MDSEKQNPPGLWPKELWYPEVEKKKPENEKAAKKVREKNIWKVCQYKTKQEHIQEREWPTVLNSAKRSRRMHAEINSITGGKLSSWLTLQFISVRILFKRVTETWCDSNLIINNSFYYYTCKHNSLYYSIFYLKIHGIHKSRNSKYNCREDFFCG